MSLVYPARLPVLDHADAPLRWLSGDQARQAALTGDYRVIHRGGCVRALKVREHIAAKSNLSRHPTGRHYSHKRETQRNPAGVWCFEPVGKSPLPFIAVLRDAGAK